jgi:hypothetical protein
MNVSLTFMRYACIQIFYWHFGASMNLEKFTQKSREAVFAAQQWPAI